MKILLLCFSSSRPCRLHFRQSACLSRASMRGLKSEGPYWSSSKSEVRALVPAGWVAAVHEPLYWANIAGLSGTGMCTFDFDLSNITSIDRRTVLRFTCWEKYLLRPSWNPRHKPPSHCLACSCQTLWWWIFHGLLRLTPNHCCHQEATTNPPTAAITSWVLVLHRAVKLSRRVN